MTPAPAATVTLLNLSAEFATEPVRKRDFESGTKQLGLGRSTVYREVSRAGVERAAQSA